MTHRLGQLVLLKESKEYAFIVGIISDTTIRVRKVGILNEERNKLDVNKTDVKIIKTQKVNEVKDILKVGDYVISNADGSKVILEYKWIYGKVGEIIGDKIFYLWNNTQEGSRGNVPVTKFNYSWKIKVNETSEARILILEEAIKSNIKCFKCKEELAEGDSNIGADDEKYCSDCFEENFHRCERCEEVIWQDDSCYIDDKIYCQECYDEYYTTCAGCDDTIRREDDNTYRMDGEYYCEDCYHDRYSTCDGCQCVFHNDDIQYVESEDEYRCSDCRRQRISRNIHDYGFMPDAVFQKEKWEDDLYLGIELEVLHKEYGNAADDLLAYLEELKVENRFYFKNDGSLDDEGFEIVTHPETLKSIHRNLKLIKIFEWLNKNDFDSEKSGLCGLHVHINKAILEDLDITKMRLFFKVNQKQLHSLSRRDGESAYALYEKRDIMEIIHGEQDTERYNAINLNSSRETIELRLFRGTLNYKRVLAILQFSDALVRFVKRVGITCFIYGEGKYRNNSWGLFVDWIKEENRYKELVQHLVAEKLVEAK